MHSLLNEDIMLTLELVRLLEILNSIKKTLEVLFLIMKNKYIYKNGYIKNAVFLWCFTLKKQNKKYMKRPSNALCRNYNRIVRGRCQNFASNIISLGNYKQIIFFSS